MTNGKTISLTRRTFVDKVVSLLFNMMSSLVIPFLPRSKRLLISWFICSDMCVLHANIQTPGLRKLEKGILVKDMNSKIKTEKCKEKKIHLLLQLFLSLHIRLFFMGSAFVVERPVDPLIEIWCQWVMVAVGMHPLSGEACLVCGSLFTSSFSVLSLCV